MRFLTSFLALFLCSFLAGRQHAAEARESSNEARSTDADLDSKAGKARIYILRKDKGSRIAYVDMDKSQGALAAGQYVSRDVQPGVYELYARMESDSRPAKHSVTVEEGQIYFFRIKYSGFTGPKIVNVTETQGKDAVRGCDRSTLDFDSWNELQASFKQLRKGMSLEDVKKVFRDNAWWREDTKGFVYTRKDGQTKFEISLKRLGLSLRFIEGELDSMSYDRLLGKPVKEFPARETAL